MKPQSAGVRRVLITIQRIKSSVSIGLSGHVDETDDANWETYWTCWSAWDTRPGTEALVGDQNQASRAVVVEVPYSSVANRIDTKMRVKKGSAVYSISEPPINVDQMNRTVRFSVRQVVL